MWKTYDKRDKICSGLLLKDVPLIINYKEKDNFIEIEFGLIITQPCDIEGYYISLEKGEEVEVGETKLIEFRDRSIITQIILCPLFDENKFSSGHHLRSTYNYQLAKLSENEIERYKKKEHCRYHYIKSDIDEIPNYFLDFKHYFTLPISTAIILSNRQNDLYCLEHLYFTEISDRFSHYNQRVGII